MKTLLLLRHAKSSWDDPAMTDHERPLNERGLRTAPLMGDLIKEANLVPEFILSSTARRAKKTAELVAKHCGYHGDVHLAKELYNASPENYIKVLRTLNKEYKNVLLVGHNPTLEILAEILTHETYKFPTAGLLHVELPINHWYELSLETHAKVLHIWKPKELDP